MLVFISDLHLNDGSSGTHVHPGAFHIFAERLRYLAARASWRADGSYRPVDHIDLVLLGDVLDIVHSDRWLQTTVRPWDDIQSPAVMQTVIEIVDAILARNEAALSVLRGLVTQGLVCVAAPARNGQPVYHAPPLAVPVRLYYMVGNHDWMLHVPGRGYDTLRQRVTHQMALANPLNQPLPHEAAESDVLLDTFRRHRVVARHGDIYDPLNFSEDRNTSSLGDAIVIQLISRFAAAVEQELGPVAPLSLRQGLRELDHIRPLVLAPVWLDGLLERASPSPALRKQVKQVWDRLADDFLQLPMVRQQDTWKPADFVDGLEQTLKFSKRLSVGWASKVAAWLATLRGARGPSYYEHALTEPDFRNRRACHIVYGHTHQPEAVPLDASYADGSVLNQMYFNCGTWRRVYQPTQWAPAEHEFIPAENMTYLAFFEGDERGGRPYEMWTGTLGVAAEDPVPRDAAGARFVAQSARPPMPAAHFVPAPAGLNRMRPVA
jgi:UDP-2,3-diacylglucosamine pyrophosphatase LpxH